MELLTECSRKEMGWLWDARGEVGSGGRGLILERVVKDRESGPIFGRRAVLVMSVESEEGSLGWSRGNSLPIKMDLGAVVGERFCVKRNGSFLPTLYTTVLYSSGFRAVSKTMRTMDQKSMTVIIVLDQDSTEAFRIVLQDKADCKFCSMCDLVCECGKESHLSAAESQCTSGANDLPVWDLFCNILMSAGETTCTTEVFICGRLFPGSFQDTIRQREVFCFTMPQPPRLNTMPIPKAPCDLSPSSLLTNNDAEDSNWLLNETCSPEVAENKLSAANTTTNNAAATTTTTNTNNNINNNGAMRFGHYKDETKCRRCGASFTRNADLIRHVQGVHEAIRKYKCTKCDRSFTQNAHLKGHYKSVHDKVRDWNCNGCGRSFSTKFQLERHQKSIHGIVRGYVADGQTGKGKRKSTAKDSLNKSDDLDRGKDKSLTISVTNGVIGVNGPLSGAPATMTSMLNSNNSTQSASNNNPALGSGSISGPTSFFPPVTMSSATISSLDHQNGNARISKPLSMAHPFSLVDRSNSFLPPPKAPSVNNLKNVPTMSSIPPKQHDDLLLYSRFVDSSR